MDRIVLNMWTILSSAFWVASHYLIDDIKSSRNFDKKINGFLNFDRPFVYF